jgi:hypothetical protein
MTQRIFEEEQNMSNVEKSCDPISPSSKEQEQIFLNSILNFLEANLSSVDLLKCELDIKALVMSSRWEHDMLGLLEKEKAILKEFEHLVSSQSFKSSVDISNVVSTRMGEFEEVVHMVIKDSKTDQGDRKRKRDENRAAKSVKINGNAQRPMPTPKKPRVENVQ